MQLVLNPKDPSALPRWELAPDADVADRVRLQLTGAWKLDSELPEPLAALERLAGTDRKRLMLATDDMQGWDTGLLVYVQALERGAAARGVEVDRSGLPEGALRLLRLAEAVPPASTGGADRRGGVLARVGEDAVRRADAAADAVRFLGETVLALIATVRGRARFRLLDLGLALDASGPKALPIVTLIGLLAGMILAFVGAIQLVQFGAEVYVANLVALGMLREMGALMAAVIMAGRTGAAFAAEIGTMKVNEEIDALVTTGLEPTAFLVLPRVLALVLMLPLLTVYADLLGMLGGAAIGVLALGIPPALYIGQSLEFVGPNDLAVGLIKGVAFAFIVALCGCYHGMRCGRSSAAVGDAATAAVVTSLVGIVVADALLTIFAYAIGL